MSRETEERRETERDRDREMNMCVVYMYGMCVCVCVRKKGIPLQRVHMNVTELGNGGIRCISLSLSNQVFKKTEKHRHLFILVQRN